MNILRMIWEVFGVTLPIFAVIAVGYFLRRKNIINNSNISLLNNLAYNFGLSTLIFTSIISNRIEDILDPDIIKVVYSTFFAFLAFIILLFIFTKIENSTKGALIVSSYRTNMAFVGFPIMLFAYGSLAVAKASIVIALLVPFNIITTVVILKLSSHSNKRIGVRKTIIDIVTDPMIIAVIAGLLVAYFKIDLPGPVDKVLSIFSGMAIPVALISIGASFKFVHIKKNLKFVTVSCILKLIIYPLFALFFSMFVFKVDVFDRNIMCVLFGMPLAIATFFQAKRYNADEEFISSALIVSVIASSLTISGWLFLMKLI